MTNSNTSTLESYIPSAINKRGGLYSLGLEVSEAASACRSISGGVDDGGWDELARALFALSDMEDDMSPIRQCPSGGVCDYYGECDGILEGSSGCAYLR